MKKLALSISSCMILALCSCKKDQNADYPKSEENNHGEIFRSPAETEKELVKKAKSSPLTTLALSESDFDFGKIKKGESVKHDYEVTNTGDKPLIISYVKPGCGCTVSEFTKDPILPGKKGKITLKFDSSNFNSTVHKQAEVYANVDKTPIIIHFTADIQP